MRSRRQAAVTVVGAALLAAWTLTRAGAAWADGAAPVEAVFELSDAMVKGSRLAGVEVRAARSDQSERLLGVTDAAGRLAAQLEPGEWLVTCRREGYVPLERTPVTVGAAETVSIALSPLLEAIGDAGRRRVQIVLNWGSDDGSVRDVDAHLRCGCSGAEEVYFSNRDHAADGHSAALDVDDMDGGGPETITLLDPPPGEHEYWVVRYSSPPPHLAGSQIVVRVVFDDRVAGEFRVPAGLERRVWRPFKRLRIGPDLSPAIVPFTPEELAREADRSTEVEDAAQSSDEKLVFGCCCGFPVLLVVGVIATLVALGRRRRR